LTFNIEHVFENKKHPDIGKRHCPVTADEMRELSEFAAEYHVDIIPFQQSLGHLRGIISLPEYEDIAYDKSLSWSLNPQNERSYELLSDLYEAQIDSSSSKYFHIGCDEPFDILKNFDPDKFNGRSLAEVLKDHICKLHNMLSAKGRKTMVWADSVLAHPEILAGLPKDLILCHWMYGSGNLEGPEHYRPSLEKISGSGLPFYACTCSWSLMKIFPDLAVMEKNHKSFVQEAKNKGAEGMMLTIWGDMGHMNLIGLELYPLAFGARYAWENEPEEIDFDLAFSWHMERDEKGTCAKLIQELDMTNRILQGPQGLSGTGFLLLFDEPFSTTFLKKMNAFQERVSEDKAFDPATISDNAIALYDLCRLPETARDLLTNIFHQALTSDSPISERSFWGDYFLPIVQTEIVGLKLTLLEFLKHHWPTRNENPSFSDVLETAAGFCDQIAEWLSEGEALFSERWILNSKESDLAENRNRYQKLTEAWQARADEMRGYKKGLADGKKLPELQEVISNPPSGYVFDMLKEMGLSGLL
jgi:glycosyl hydrolase family 20